MLKGVEIITNVTHTSIYNNPDHFLSSVSNRLTAWLQLLTELVTLDY